MILQKEISEKAEEWQVSKSTVDKDWTLGHLLNGIYKQEFCQKNWVFKGGTCLKKCYFENYRFSEDLDFTILLPEYELEEAFIEEVCRDVERLSGIRFHLQELRPMFFNEQRTGYKAVIKFWGADHPKNVSPPPSERWQTSVKIELIQFEEMLFNTVNKPLFHPYSDKELITAVLPCYSIEEVLAEKLRALIQRKYTAPRDYYDIWYLSRNYEKANWDNIVKAFHKKMIFKGLRFEGIEQLLHIEEKSFKIHWQNSLGNHLSPQQLPDWETVIKELKELLEKYF